jgi:hypothetical protein
MPVERSNSPLCCHRRIDRTTRGCQRSDGHQFRFPAGHGGSVFDNGPQSEWLTARAARLVFVARALVPVKLFLEIGLCVYRLAQSGQGDFEFFAAKGSMHRLPV